MYNVCVVFSFYVVWLKIIDCGIEYGCNYYDFEEGVLVFIVLQQVVLVSGEVVEDEDGWMLFFYFDLIWFIGFGGKISQYIFFLYEIYEVLYFLEVEKVIIMQCI